MSNEKSYSPISGYLIFLIIITLLAICLAGVIFLKSPVFIFLVLPVIFLMPGFFFLNPNSSMVLVLFGDYRGTVKSSGFFWVNPLFSRKSISLRARNLIVKRLR
jgi:regulator of protease activity HflC (stomatin/prohibitin superfamily)